jgi:hypothetical protein
MKINGATGASDNLNSPTIALDGALVNSNISLAAPTNAETFTLFTATQAGGLTGAFKSTFPATPGPGQTWNTNNLYTTGTLSVVGNPPVTAPPAINAVGRSTGNLVFSGTNGTPGGAYYLVSSTNLVLPLTNWTVLSTNTFNTSGGFSVTNAIGTNGATFYRLEIP